MTKPLRLDDFRAVRIVLEPDDFALGSGIEPPPSDLVDKGTWHGITMLPDDVSIRTSNNHGKLLKILYDVGVAWIHAVGENQDFLYGPILDATDEFDATTYNSLCGYYRQAIGCLRSALELITIGTYCQVCCEETKYKDWRQGKYEIKFGESCDNIGKAASVKALEVYLDNTVKDSIFAQKTQAFAGGWVRRLYYELSNYSHTRPGYTSGDMWASNGPIYVREAFISTAEMYIQVSAICFILIKLARPLFTLPKDALPVFETSRLQSMKIARIAYEYLFID